MPTVVDPNPLSTGAFVGTEDPGAIPITFFCFQLTESFSFGNPYAYDDSAVSGGKYDTLGELFTEAFATATASPLNSAAFQLAVWEILEETTPGSLSPGVGQGSFYVTNDHGNAATVAAANALIAGLPSTSTYGIRLLNSDTNQDFVYGVTSTLFKVPEPGPLSLVARGADRALRRTSSRRREARGLIQPPSSTWLAGARRWPGGADPPLR